MPVTNTIANEVRETTFVVSSPTTGPFALDFPCYEATDVTALKNDLVVTDDGVVTTDYSLSATFLAGVAIAVTLTFNAVVSGTIVITSARPPRSGWAFQTGMPTSKEQWNSVFNSLTASVRDGWDDFNRRGLRAPPGESLTDLGSKANRASKFLAFDGAGNPLPTTLVIGAGLSITVVATRAALASLAVAVGIAFLDEGKRAGFFVWKTGNQSASVTADPQQGIYVAPASDTTGASGAWVRDRADNVYLPEWFGCVGDQVANDTTAMQGAVNYMEVVGGELHFSRFYLVTSTIAYISDLPITITGTGSDNCGLVCDVAAGVDGLTLTFSAWNTSGVPELYDFAILTKKAATVAGTALKIVYTTLPGSGSRKGVVVSNLKLNTHPSGNNSTDYWTRGIFAERAPHSRIEKCWIQARTSITSAKSGVGIQFGTWMNGTRISANTIRGFERAFYVTSVFESPNTFQCEGLRHEGGNYTNNDYGIDVDLWLTETAHIITGAGLDNSICNIRLKNMVNCLITGCGMNHNGQLKAHTDILLLTTAQDAGGAAAAGQGRNSVTGNNFARASLSNAITGITRANPAVVTYTGDDNWVNGGKIFITGVAGMTQVNKIAFTVANLNAGANTFELRNEADTANINSSAYGVYTSGGLIEALSIAIDIQGGNNSEFALNSATSRSIGVRIGALVGVVNVDKNPMNAVHVDVVNLKANNNDTFLTGRRAGASFIQKLAADQSIPDTTITNVVNWGTGGADVVDRGGATATASQMTVAPGSFRVRVEAQIAFKVSATGIRQLRVIKNGATSLGYGEARTSAAPAGTTVLNCAAEFDVAEDDTFSVQVSQTSGAALDIATGDQSWFRLTVIS